MEIHVVEAQPIPAPTFEAVKELLWKQTLDEVYAERNMCVCLIARMAMALGILAFVAPHEGADWDEDWRNVVFVELPTGQVSWHVHDSDMPMFDFLPNLGRGSSWDGHDTEEKYRRVIAPFVTDTFSREYLQPIVPGGE